MDDANSARKASADVLSDDCQSRTIIERAPCLSSGNADSIREHQKCGCYFCVRVFDSKDVTEFTDNGSAICPNCGTDALLPGVTDLSVLESASERWFAEAAR